MALGDIYEISTFCRHASGQNQVNVTHLKITDLVGITPLMTEIADFLSGVFATEIAPLLPQGSSYQGCTLREIFPDVSQLTVSQDGSFFSASTDDAIPSQVGPLLSIRSTVAPPRVRGRMYLPSCGEGDIEVDGKLTAAFQLSVATFGQDYLNTDHVLTVGADVATFRARLWSPTQGADYPITTIITRQYLATQRRRGSLNSGDRLFAG